MADDMQLLILKAIDRTTSPSEWDALQDAVERNKEVRNAYVRAVGLAESLREIAIESETGRADSIGEADVRRAVTRPTVQGRKAWRGGQVVAALAFVMLVGGGAFWLGRVNQQNEPLVLIDQEPAEAKIAGHATLRRAVGVKWPAGATRRFEGDVLPNGTLAFDAGVAEIDFFCGATLIVEGPASLDVESDWSVRVAEGRVRASVPPAARGFVVKAADSEIVDLGTEFAVEVKQDQAQVEVVDGEVVLRGGEHDGKHLLTGEGVSLKGANSTASVSAGISTMAELQDRQRVEDQQRFEAWKKASDRLRTDNRLLAYYPIAAGFEGRSVPNAASTGRQSDGLVVGPVNRVEGRFGATSAGVDFDRPGARVRTRIDGEFEAFSFACWVRIDSLPHRYNALFMADGYENGEPHWQIRDDGRLMFSVMVDDSQKIEHFSELDQQVVQQAGLHRVYYSVPIWDVSKSGQWFHLAAVYDPASRQVRQYVNGRLAASEAIVDKFYTQTLRIGAGEIGNWGQPFRETAWFAVRNLNGTIDEMAIFNAALSTDEIDQLYQEGKPVGY